MHVVQRGDDFEFDDKLVLGQQASGLFAYDYVVVKDDHSPLRDGAEPALSHFVAKGIFGNLFNDPMTEHIGNPESAPHDPLGHRRQQPGVNP
jgi:hypothetical protein